MDGGAATRAGAGTVHVVGAGLAGLSAALRLAEAGWRVRVHEAAGQAGGRCRSYPDARLGCRIDNGNHLLMSANRAALAYLADTGAADALTGPAQAVFPFVDLARGRRYAVRPNAGPVPWWIASPRRRVPGTGLGDYLAGLAIARARPGTRLGALVRRESPLYRAFWEPFTVAVLNVDPAEADAGLLRAVLSETFARGGRQCRPLVAREGLSEAFVAPALARLAALGVEVRLKAPLRAVEVAADGLSAAALVFPDGERIALGPADRVVLAVPPGVAAKLLPAVTVPEGASPILNAHYRLDRRVALPDGAPALGVLGGTAQWIFVRPLARETGTVVSVTVSAADALIDDDGEDLAARIWADVAAALEVPADPMPPARIVKERRATFRQTPENTARRSGAGDSGLANLVLAGDWTATGLPATIEGAIRSGEIAARRVGPGAAGHPGDHTSVTRSEEVA
ncbi:MAG: hydroxysqualene dehydroxylase HpnE [Azospirillaceae bacterium]